MRAIFPFFVVAVLALLCRGAAAQSIQYVAKERRVRAFHYEVLDDGDTQTIIRATKEVVAGFGDFDAVARAQAVPEFEGAYAEVSQRSAFRGGITASGTIRGQTWTLWGGYDWESVVGATFDVVGGPVRYELEYAIEQMETGEGFRFNDFTLITVSPEPLTVFDFDIPDPAEGDDTARGTVSGVLSPGRYAFAYRDESLRKDIGENLDYEWAFRLTPVPEPGSVAGIVVLTAPLLLRRCRRRSSRTSLCYAK
jgi:hypothetical protein